MPRPSPSPSRADEVAGCAAEAPNGASGSAGRVVPGWWSPTNQMSQPSSSDAYCVMEAKSGDDWCALVAVRNVCTSCLDSHLCACRLQRCMLVEAVSSKLHETGSGCRAARPSRSLAAPALPPAMIIER